MKYNRRSNNGKFLAKSAPLCKKDIYDMMKELGKKSQYDQPVFTMGTEARKRFNERMEEEFNKSIK